MAQAGQMLDGRYRLVETLGRGGMGEVWRARHERLDRDVAVKVLADPGDADAKYAKLFQSEAKAAARLQHPGITVVHDFGADQDQLFLVMELLPGETLAAVLRRHPDGAPAAVLSWGAQIAETLAAAHVAGVVHRDIKPGNLMLLPGGQIKICDFGIARLQDATASVTAAGMGTAAYMAPEQLIDGAIDGRTDIYALGCTLYHLLTGQAPFEASNPWAVARKQLDEDPVSARTLRPDIPETVERLLLRMLAKDPADRPQHAREVAALLAEAAGRPTDPTDDGTSPGPDPGPPAGQVPSTSRSTGAVARPGSGERAMLLVSGGLLIVGVWTLLAIASVNAPMSSPITARILPFVASGMSLPLLLLHRDPRARRARRLTGLWVAGASSVFGFLVGLVLVLEHFVYLWNLWDRVLVVPGLTLLASAGPGIALVEIGVLGPLGGPPGRPQPRWPRVAAGLSLLLLLACAASVPVTWATEEGLG